MILSIIKKTMMNCIIKRSNVLTSLKSSSVYNIIYSSINNNHKLCYNSISLLQSSNYKKYYSTSLPSALSLNTNQLPPNLKLDDVSILVKKDDFKVTIPEHAYYFPQLDIPDTIKVTKFNKPGEFSSDAPLNKKIFGVALRKDIVHEVIRYQRHKIRQPKMTKRIGDISGSNKKPWAQKKVGKAQVGNKRNSVWRKGQKAHGPVLRDYSIGCNKKFRALGMMISLAVKYREGNLTVFDNIQCETMKTKELANLLKLHKLDDGNLLLVVDELQENLDTASKNLPLVQTITQEGANVYTIMKKDKLALSTKALELLQNRLWSQYTHGGKRSSFLNGLEFVKSASSMSTIESQKL
jgi:large subunit ribosomal protein L4